MSLVFIHDDAIFPLAKVLLGNQISACGAQFRNLTVTQDCVLLPALKTNLDVNFHPKEQNVRIIKSTKKGVSNYSNSNTFQEQDKCHLYLKEVPGFM